ncbi:MAG: cytochrome b [Chromatiaceae bacterium]|jgi:cytochrome b561|nr:cytochrome b [Chromatiaceae bacterium]
MAELVIWRNTSNGYGLLQIALHWTLAALIAVLLPLGLWMTGLDYYDPWYNEAPDLHRSIGVLAGLVLALRGLVRLTQAQPRALTRPGWETRLALTGHLLLYALPLLLVVSGYLISTADGRAVGVFGWFGIPATLHGIQNQADIAGDIHFALAMLLLAVIALHVAAALRHHLVDRDDTLRRMWRPGITAAGTGERE